MVKMSIRYKVTAGFVLLVLLLVVTMVFIYRGVQSMTVSDDFDSQIAIRRRITNGIINELNHAEIVGQTIAVGQVEKYSQYKKNMSNADVYPVPAAPASRPTRPDHPPTRPGIWRKLSSPHGNGKSSGSPTRAVFPSPCSLSGHFCRVCTIKSTASCGVLTTDFPQHIPDQRLRCGGSCGNAQHIHSG